MGGSNRYKFGLHYRNVFINPCPDSGPGTHTDTSQHPPFSLPGA
jgi:hypothetical protein